jgi:hypothetical protein
MSKAILAMVIAVCAVFSSHSSEIVFYTNEYRGLLTGESTVAEVFKMLGEPESKQETKNGKNFSFDQVRVNFSGEDRTRINSIVVYSDQNYTTKSGVGLGTRVSELKQKVPRIFQHEDYFVDFEEGICFETDGETVREIVLTRALRKIQDK